MMGAGFAAFRSIAAMIALLRFMFFFFRIDSPKRTYQIANATPYATVSSQNNRPGSRPADGSCRAYSKTVRLTAQKSKEWFLKPLSKKLTFLK
jgi:hypothetical protein